MRTFGSLRHAGGYWVFSKIEPHVMIKLKAIFTKIPKGQTTPFKVKHTPEFAVDLAWFVERYPLKMRSRDLSHLRGERDIHLEKMASLERFFKPDYQLRHFELKKPAREYQVQGTELFLAVKRLLNGDVVGLGKTLQAIAAWCDPNTLPAAVFVQAHLPSQWKEKIEEFTDLKVHCVQNGPVYQLPTADVYIFKYTQAGKWVDILTSGIVKSVTFDEVQELRRLDSIKYNSCEKISHATPYALGLSATPIYNYGDEVWNIMNLLKEGCLGPKSDFIREWCGGYSHVVTDPKALGAYLREQHLFIRRTRKEVGRELPPTNKMVETVDYDEEAIEKIEDMAKMLAVKVMTGSFIEKGQASRDLDMMVRHATGVSKAKYVAQYVRMIVESGEPVLLAGWHRDVYDIWLKELEDLKPVMYTGSETPKQKDEAKRKFMSGESNLMMISLRSGIGLDGLQHRCSIVVIGELDWSPKVHEQILGRIERDGQKDQTTLIFLVSDSGSDPGIIEMLGLKSSQSEGIVNPFGSVEVTHSDSNRIKELAKRFLEKRGVKQLDLPGVDSDSEGNEGNLHRGA